MANSSSNRRDDQQEQPLVKAAEDRPLVPATEEQLRELRLRIGSVADEDLAKGLAGKAGSGGPPPAVAASGGGKGGRDAAVEKLDPTTTAYVRAFQDAVAGKVKAMCRLPTPRESQEEDELFGDVVRFCDEIQAAKVRLAATRTRVAGLSTATCSDAIRISEAADDRACCVLNASTEHARKEADTGGTLPVAPASNGVSGGGDGDVGPDMTAFTGIDAGSVEPKVTALIGKLTQLPGPLKAVLQEMPELTASLAVSVQNAESVMEKRESRTEALLGKAPPTPLPGKKGKAAAARGGGVGASGEPEDERHPPEEVRSAAREARVEQARKEWEAGGLGVVGGVFT